MTITSFRGNFRFLSNFFPALIEWEGIIYPTVEHAYQAAKTLDKDSRLVISKALTAQEAKHLGQKVKLREDWEKVKLELMEHFLRLKFSNREVGNLLRLTGSEELVEENWWNDRYWGICRGEGHNYLGKLLMKIRDELNAEANK